jgi:hypothetical protein
VVTNVFEPKEVPFDDLRVDGGGLALQT